MSIINVLATNCTVSKSNVRRIQNEAANGELRASIVTRGILQNLVGFAVPRKKGHYEITAGGRRLSQVLAAMTAGELPATFEVPLKVMTEKGDAAEVSLEENFQRLQMNPAEECIAFKHVIETERKSPADVAKRFGLTERFLLGRLRLANLTDVVFAALQDGEITLDMAMAYAATADVDQQARVYAQLGSTAHPNTVRRIVTTFGYRGTSSKVKLISRDDYLAAGGRLDGDLFTDDAEENWLDTHLVDKLCGEKLLAIAEATREANGLAEVRVAESANHVWLSTRTDLTPIDAGSPPLSDEAETRLAEISNELETLEGKSNDPEDEFTLQDNERFETLQAEYDRVSNPSPELTAEQKSIAIGFVYLGNDGQVHLHNEMFATPVPATVEGTDGQPLVDGEHSPDGGPATPPTAAEPEKTGVSQRLAAELAIQKTELVALHVANDPHFALDLGVFIMADRTLGDDHRLRTDIGMWGASDLPTELRASTPQSPAPDFKSNTQAAGALKQLYDALDKSWFASKDSRERFDAFRGIGEDAKAAWLGWAVARTLRPTEDGKTGASFLDHLGTTLEIDVAAWWRPTATNYFDRVSKATTLDGIQDVGTAQLKSRYASSKKAELAASAEKLFRGDTIVESEYRPAILAWVPPSMRFTPPALEIEDTDAGDTSIIAEEQPVDEPSPDLADGTIEAQLDQSDPVETANHTFGPLAAAA